MAYKNFLSLTIRFRLHPHRNVWNPINSVSLLFIYILFPPSIDILIFIYMAIEERAKLTWRWNDMWFCFISYVAFLFVSVFVCVVDALGLMLLDVGWLTLGIVWLYKFYATVEIGEAKEIMLGMLLWRISFYGMTFRMAKRNHLMNQ